LVLQKVGLGTYYSEDIVMDDTGASWTCLEALVVERVLVI
jgi:hypothetical protein